jgi:cytochrome P450
MVANLEPRIRELSHELLDPWIQRGEMDLAADYAARLPLLVIAEMLGIPLADRPQFKRWSDAILGLANTLTGGETATRALEQFSAAILEMRPYVAAQVEKRRATPSDDLLSRLVDAEVDGERLTEEEILGFFQLLLLAGSETTTNLINNAMLSLLEHPEQQERLRTTPELIPSAIEEV